MTMKSKKTEKSNYHPEFGIDSRYKNTKKKLLDGKSLMEARLKRFDKLSRRQIVKARLLQLKLRMEEYLETTDDEESNQFTNFLTVYIDTIYEKRSLFAKDLNISPVSLSQVLNNHREPKEQFMFRLMLHSELSFENICSFQKDSWYKVYYHEKISETMASQNEWKPKEKKHVKIKHAILK